MQIEIQRKWEIQNENLAESVLSRWWCQKATNIHDESDEFHVNATIFACKKTEMMIKSVQEKQTDYDSESLFETEISNFFDQYHDNDQRDDTEARSDTDGITRDMTPIDLSHLDTCCDQQPGFDNPDVSSWDTLEEFDARPFHSVREEDMKLAFQSISEGWDYDNDPYTSKILDQGPPLRDYGCSKDLQSCTPAPEQASTTMPNTSYSKNNALESDYESQSIPQRPVTQLEIQDGNNSTVFMEAFDPTTGQKLFVPVPISLLGSITQQGNVVSRQKLSTSSSDRKFQRWSEEEDETLKKAIQIEGPPPHNWKRIAKKYFSNVRTGLQCKSRWTKSLQPGIVKGTWSSEEDDIIIKAKEDGLKWSEIAERLPGRISEHIRDRYSNTLDPTLKKTPWASEEDELLFQEQKRVGNKWTVISKSIPGRSENAVKNRWHNLKMAQRRRLRKECAERKRQAQALDITASDQFKDSPAMASV